MEADRRVGINEYSVVLLALFGKQDRVENLYRGTRRAMERLKMDAKGFKRFRKLPKGQGSEAGLHDVYRWLDSIKRTRKYKAERQLVKRLHLTALARVRPEVLKESDEPQGLH